MTNRSRLTAALSVPAIRLRTLVRSRTTALIAIVSINLLGISAPITAHAVTPLPSCSLTQGPPCLFGAGNFEVDGDTAVNNGGNDWANVTHTTACDLGTALNQPSATDDAFTQGSSETDTNPTIGTPGIPPS